MKHVLKGMHDLDINTKCNNFKHAFWRSTNNTIFKSNTKDTKNNKTRFQLYNAKYKEKLLIMWRESSSHWLSQMVKINVTIYENSRYHESTCMI